MDKKFKKELEKFCKTAKDQLEKLSYNTFGYGMQLFDDNEYELEDLMDKIHRGIVDAQESLMLFEDKLSKKGV